MSAKDRDLYDRILSNDVSALDEVVDLYLPRLNAIALAVTGSPDLAGDAVQDALFHFWENRQSLNRNGSALAYLVTATRNRALDLLRHEKSHERVAGNLKLDYPDVSTAAALNEGEQKVEAEELSGLIHESIRDLPPRCREIFLLNREAGLSYAQIEELLGISNATVRNQMHRAAKHLLKATSNGPLARWLLGE